MNITAQIKEAASKAMLQLFSAEIKTENIAVNETNAGFEGDYTIVLFGFLKQLQKTPDEAGKAIGNYLLQQYPQLVSSYNVVKGFLNITVSDACLLQFFAGKFFSPFRLFLQACAAIK